MKTISTNHQCGTKQVLISNLETISDITQLAITKLLAGDKIGEHVHPTMDEHYIITSGKGYMQIDKQNYDFTAGRFILVPARCYHNLIAITDLEFILISVAI